MTLHGEGATLARRWSGPRGLHRRGYRSDVKIHRGALRETTAAGLLLLAGGPLPGGGAGLLDPMCGSGTFLLEAALLLRDVAPGLVREALAVPWHAVPGERRAALAQVLATAQARAEAGRHAPRAPLLGRDAHPGALALARRSAAALERALPGCTRDVDFAVADASALGAPAGGARGWLVCCNPPWGARLGAPIQEVGADGPELGDTTAACGAAGAESSWAALGTLLRRRDDVATAWVLAPGVDGPRLLERALGTPARGWHGVDGGPRAAARAAGRPAPTLRWLRYDLQRRQRTGAAR